MPVRALVPPTALPNSVKPPPLVLIVRLDGVATTPSSFSVPAKTTLVAVSVAS